MATTLAPAQLRLGPSHASLAAAPVARRHQPRRIGLLGFGHIGQAAAEAARRNGDLCPVALVRDVSRARGAATTRLVDNPAAVLEAGVDVIVEVLGGVEPAFSLVSAALDRGIPVVTANKSLVAAHGPALRALAARRGVAFAYEAAVIAGVPFVAALAARPGLAQARALTGIVNGTSHVIATALADGGRFDDALASAQARGFAEPDARADVSGRDAAEKLTILAHLCGAAGTRTAGLVTRSLDTVDAGDFAAARALGGVIKPVAHAVFGGDGAGAWVGPAWVDAAHPLAGFQGVTNALLLHPKVGAPILFAGPGAGPDVTAATILDDVHQALNAAPGAGAAPVWPGAASGDTSASGAALSSVPAGAWFLRLASTEFSAAHLAEFLAGQHVPATRIETGAFGLAARTVAAPFAAIDAAAATLEAIGARVTCVPALGVEEAGR